MRANLSITGSFTVALGQYPISPSFNLCSTPLAGLLRARWHDIEDGLNSVLAGGYWFLTTFETEFGGSRIAAAKGLGVDSSVLSTLGRLTARNDPLQSRKNKGPKTPLSEDEKVWVKAAVRILMRRAVEVRSGRSGLSLITMSDLPKI
jgi:hypothetical protein